MPSNRPRFYRAQLLIASSTLLFLLIAGTLTWIALGQIEEQQKASTHQSLHTVLQTTQEGLHLWKEFRFRHIKEQASRPELVRLTEQLLGSLAPQEQLLNLAELRTLLRPELTKNQDLGFFIIDPSRVSRASLRDSNLNSINLIAQQRPDLLAKVFSGRTLLIPTIASDVALDNGAESAQSQPPTLFFATPIRNQQQRVIAVLTLRVNHNQHFSQITLLGRIGATGETYAFDSRGLMLTRSRFEEQLRQIGLLAPGENSTLNIRISDPGSNLVAGEHPTRSREQQPLTLMVQQALEYKNKHHHDSYPDYRGVPVFGAWTWDHELGVGLATEIDAAEALQPYHQTRFTLLSLLGSTALLGLLLVVLIFWLERRTIATLKQAYNFLELRVQERTEELSQAKEQLEQANCRLQQQAHTDTLTGLANRREMDHLLEREWQRCSRESSPFSVILLDIDYFKRYNDYYGHQQGDRCLIRIAHLFKELQVTNRPGDLIARYGGEEFIFILSQTDHHYAHELAELICRGVAELAIPHASSEIADTVTVSLGVATEVHTAQSHPDHLISQADQALYQAKKLGRNNVHSYTEDSAEPQE